MPRYLWTILFLFVLISLNGFARAQKSAPARAEALAGTSFTYQGQLKDASGPVAGICDFQFGLWDALTSGTQVGSTLTQTGVAVSEGLFTVQLDFGSNAFNGSSRWLEIDVRCPAGSGSYSTLAPRQPLTSAPYSLYSANAGTATNLSGVLPVSNGGTGSATKNFVDLSTDQPVGGVKTFSNAPSFTASSAPFSVSSTGVVTNLNADLLDGQHASAFASATHNHWGESWSGSGTGLTLSGDVGLLAYATYGSGVVGVSNNNTGSGVYGYANATTGLNYGVYGTSNSNSGFGVFGLAAASTGMNCGIYGQSNSDEGFGVYGYASITNGSTYGVWGRADSTAGVGVYGYVPAESGVTNGVLGQSNSNQGTGVYGVSTAGGGDTYGVKGKSSSNTGIGVYGLADASSGITNGVRGESFSTNGVGVEGIVQETSGGNIGVWGLSYSPDGYGVYGAATNMYANYGVFSWGNFAATGTKSAVVDTQDYGWVSLYSMESPRVLFEDVNTAQLVNGTATVTIDPIFAQTVDLSQPYQVFPAPNGNCSLYVSQKTNTSFSVAAIDGKTCTIAFDYRIIAVRKGYTDTRLEPAEDPEQVTRLVNPVTVPPVR